jgi:hypothetical protein
MLSKAIFKKLDEYLKKYEGPWLTDSFEESSDFVPSLRGYAPASKTVEQSEESLELNAFLKNKKIFFQVLADLKDASEGKKGKNQKFSEVYRKAFVSKQIFHNIFDGDFVPSKDTVFKFAFALEAAVEEAKTLLGYAGYAFGDCIKRDLILRFCFENKITDFLEINDILKQQNQKALVKEAKKREAKKLVVLQ